MFVSKITMPAFIFHFTSTSHVPVFAIKSKISDFILNHFKY